MCHYIHATVILHFLGNFSISGRVIVSPEEASRLNGVYPVKFDIKGAYGVAINWSDGHFADIYSFDTLKQIAKE